MPTIYSAEQYPQGGLPWLELRAGIPTASELEKILKPTFELKEAKKAGDINQAVWSYVCSKAAERYAGIQWEEGFGGSWAMEKGKLKEPDARAWFELTYDCDIALVSFVKADGGLFGCSPDGVIYAPDGTIANGLELKCLEQEHHCKLVLEDEMPSEYLHQIHGSIYATNAPRWTFCAWRQDWPCLVKTVERDEKIMASIKASIAEFSALVDGAYSKLKKKK